MRKHIYTLRAPDGTATTEPTAMTAAKARALNAEYERHGEVLRWMPGGTLDALHDTLPVVRSELAAAARIALIKVRGATAAYERALLALANGELSTVEQAIDREIDVVTILAWLSGHYPELDSANHRDSQLILGDLTEVCVADDHMARTAAIDRAIARIRTTATRIMTDLTILWHRAPVRPATTARSVGEAA